MIPRSYWRNSGAHWSARSWGYQVLIPEVTSGTWVCLSRHIHVDDGFDGFKTLRRKSQKMRKTCLVSPWVKLRFQRRFQQVLPAVDHRLSSASTSRLHQKSKSRWVDPGGSSGFGDQRQPIQRYVAWRKGIDHYPLVNIQNTIERSTIFQWENPLYITMVIFNSYVSLPEGNDHYRTNLPT